MGITSLTVAACSHRGQVRPTNQDAFYVDPGQHFFIVADGMGGHAAGEVASDLAVKAVTQSLRHFLVSTKAPSEGLQTAAQLANTVILEDARRHPSRHDMGTTLVIAMLHESQLWYAHSGDSRLYLWRRGQLRQLTADHTLVAQYVAQGLLNAEEAREHPYRHILSRCLGQVNFLGMTVDVITPEPQDRYLLCSDGLTGELTDCEISVILEGTPDVQSACEQLLEQALNHGGQDNITIVLLNSSG